MSVSQFRIFSFPLYWERVKLTPNCSTGPELLCFLEPIETGSDDFWKKRWLKESHIARKDRRRVRIWLQSGGGKAIPESINPDEGEENFEVPIMYSPDHEHFDHDEQASHADLHEQSNESSRYPPSARGDDLEDVEGGENEFDFFDFYGDEEAHENFERGAQRTPSPEEIQEGRDRAFQALHGVYK